MSNNKYIDEADDFFIEEEKTTKIGHLRQESEFFDNDSYVPHTVISVRRAKLKKGENWEILKDKKIVLLLKGTRFSKQERNFLRTPNGIMFLIDGYKNGWKSVSEFKRQVEKCIK